MKYYHKKLKKHFKARSLYLNKLLIVFKFNSRELRRKRKIFTFHRWLFNNAGLASILRNSVKKTHNKFLKKYFVGKSLYCFSKILNFLKKKTFYQPDQPAHR